MPISKGSFGIPSIASDGIHEMEVTEDSMRMPQAPLSAGVSDSDGGNLSNAGVRTPVVISPSGRERLADDAVLQEDDPVRVLDHGRVVRDDEDGGPVRERAQVRQHARDRVA